MWLVWNSSAAPHGSIRYNRPFEPDSDLRNQRVNGELMMLRRLRLLLVLALWGSLAARAPARGLQNDTPAGQLPAELRGAKVYHLDLAKNPDLAPEKLTIYKNITYQDINLERLVLNLYLSIKPVDRAATIQRLYFQDVRVNALPVHIETFEQEFQLSKKEVVDLPSPLKCTIVFAELDSLKPVMEILEKDSLRITGENFIEVKMNAVEKLALRSKQLVIPVAMNEHVPLNLFSGNPLLQMAASKILDTLSDPSSLAALALARDHLAKLAEDQTLSAAARPALYLLYCQYTLVDPKTQAKEKFSQCGTGFVVSAEGKLLTAKRVVQPWKFDPQIAFLIAHYHLELDPKSYCLYAWPAGARVKSPDGGLDFQMAASSEKATLKLLKTAPDRMQKKDYQDPDSGERASFDLEAEGESDLALLQLAGANLKPLAFADSAAETGEATKKALFGFPFGLNQSQADPRAEYLQATTENAMVTLERLVNPGESGAPLLTAEGKVLAIASGANQCVAIQAARKLIP
jgi:hypothetical protein